MARLFRGIVEAAAGITPEIRARFSDESLCRRCGRCCFSGVRVKDRMVLIRDLPCRYLCIESDGLTSCAVYSSRELTGWCHKVCPESIRKDLFAPDCPYVQGLPRYQGKVEISDSEFEEIKPILRDVFKLVDKPDYVRHSDWDRFLHHVLELPR
jgi:uncharacterized cysteine cluster protein YcgN (CxxCxxCC family)